jgi:hypothetical protein
MARPKKQDAAPAGFLPVEYIGPRAQYTDGMYGTYIHWSRIGAVQLVPEAIAKKMATHAAVYRIAAYSGEAAPDLPEKPNTDEADQRQELDNVIQTMDKVALEGYARVNFGQELDRRQSVETLRQKVKMLVDQYGAP